MRVGSSFIFNGVARPSLASQIGGIAYLVLRILNFHLSTRLDRKMFTGALKTLSSAILDAPLPPWVRERRALN